MVALGVPAGRIGIPKHEHKGLSKKGRAGFTREFPQSCPRSPGTVVLGPQVARWHRGGLGTGGSTRTETPSVPLCKAAGVWLPALDDLWVITADNEIFNRRG